MPGDKHRFSSKEDKQAKAIAKSYKSKYSKKKALSIGYATINKNRSKKESLEDKVTKLLDTPVIIVPSYYLPLSSSTSNTTANINASNLNEASLIKSTDSTNSLGDSAAGIILVSASSGRILINQRTYASDFPSRYAIYGGRFWLDPNESIDTLSNRELLRVALLELYQETGYRPKPSNVKFLYDYYIESKNWHYFTFLATVPREFHLNPRAKYKLESGPGSGWWTFSKLINLKPKHPGLVTLLKNVGYKIRLLVNQLGFSGNEEYHKDEIIG